MWPKIEHFQNMVVTAKKIDLVHFLKLGGRGKQRREKQSTAELSISVDLILNYQCVIPHAHKKHISELATSRFHLVRGSFNYSYLRKDLLSEVITASLSTKWEKRNFKSKTPKYAL